MNGVSHPRAIILLLALLCAVLTLAAWPGTARANIGSPHQEGDPVGEPSGALADIVVERETLTIDLRPLATAGTAVIEAIYHLRNHGAARTVDLVFVATGQTAGEFSVWVNETPVPATRRTDLPLPNTWRPPTTTPAFTEGRTLPYEVDQGGGPSMPFLVEQGSGGRISLTFQAHLEAGAGVLRVRYGARAAAYSGDAPARYWQLGYVLAPARDWAAFGRLDVTVLLPPGWRAAAEPALTHTGDTLSGSFPGLPADTLALTAQFPYTMRPDLLPLAGIGGAAVTLAVAALCGRWLGRRQRSLWWLLPVALLLAIGWTAVVLKAGLWPRADVPVSQDAWTYDYDRMFLLALSVPFIFAGGLALTFVTGAFARRPARPRLGQS